MSVEALGFAEPEIDAELIVMAARLWQRLRVSGVKLELNSIGTAESRREYREVLVEYFSRYRESLDEDSLRRLERNPLRILDSKVPQMRPIVESAPLLSDYLDDESRAHFDRVQQLLTDLDVPFTLNPRLVRGLDYYSRTVFEWITQEARAQNAICSGGRYDGLVAQLGGRDTPAVGWALGIERIVELMQAQGIGPGEAPLDAQLVAAGDAERRFGFEVVDRLRERVPGARISLGMPSASFKAQLRHADKSGARFALIVGESELAAAKVALKPLRDGKPQRLLTVEECADVLRQSPASA
jgi:histidyl-tRNA synthetase